MTLHSAERIHRVEFSSVTKFCMKIFTSMEKKCVLRVTYTFLVGQDLRYRNTKSPGIHAMHKIRFNSLLRMRSKIYSFASSRTA